MYAILLIPDKWKDNLLKVLGWNWNFLELKFKKKNLNQVFRHGIIFQGNIYKGLHIL